MSPHKLMLLPLLLLAQPVLAQHDHHAGDQTEAAPPAPGPAEPDHSKMDHGHAGHQAEPPRPAPAAPPAHDHSGMDHGKAGHSGPGPAPAAVDRSAMGHGHAGHDAAAPGEEPIPEGPPPPEAFSGPAFAADPAVGPRMAEARAAVVREVSGMPVGWFQADRLEYRAHQGKDGYLWDLQGYYGGDYDKLWLKSEGEGTFGEKPEGAEVQALWSHAVDPWWDLQLGLRQDLAGPDRTHAVIGIQGMAPYEYEIDAALFVSHKGDVTARIEAELDQRITQRLILQPRGELALSAQDIPALGVGAGFDHVELGVRLRYEIVRQFAPYIGIEHEQKLGASADYAKAAGEDPGVTSVVAGIRLWF